MLLRPPPSTLFPYTTLFRSEQGPLPPGRAHREHLAQVIAIELVNELFLGDVVTRPDERIAERAPRRVGDAHVSQRLGRVDRKSTRLNSSHQIISYAVFCLKK